MSVWENTSFGPVKGKPLSPFISKLKLLLNDEKYHRAIHWSENGTAIVVTDWETFKKLVLDRSEEMFKTRNFTSFVRQLNLYGFRKVPVSGKADPSKNMKFEHVNFKRDKPELMHLVIRTCPSRKKKRTENNSKHHTRKYSTFLGTRRSTVVEEHGKVTDKSAFFENPNSSPNKSGSEFNYSKKSPFEVGNVGNQALEDYLHWKFRQEEGVAVELLLNLQNPTVPSTSYLPSPLTPCIATSRACAVRASTLPSACCAILHY